MNEIIKEILPRKIFDSRGSFTVEVSLICENGIYSKTDVPNSTSTGTHEINAFPDGDVDKGIRAFNSIKSKLIGQNPHDQANIDEILHLESGRLLEKTGGNIAVGISISAAKAAAKIENIELYEYVNKYLLKGSGIKQNMPRPIGNLLGGGSHSKSSMALQEILVSPNTKSFTENAQLNAQIHKSMGDKLSKQFPSLPLGVNFEGAWCSPLLDAASIESARSTLNEFIDKSEIDISLGIDFAASEYYKDKEYRYKKEIMDRTEQIEFVKDIASRFEVEYIEDALHEEDFEGFAQLTKALGNGHLIVGDDLYTTNLERFKKGIKLKSTNCILIKVNQIGTLSDTIEVVKLAHKSNIKNVVSHRSKETQDTFISHLAIAFGSVYIKAGIVGGERIAKINELSRIEQTKKV